MKKLKSLICIILVAVLLSGCSFHLASSVNDLISAVPPFGDNAKVKDALDKYLTNDYSLKNPAVGKHITSFSFCDLNNDKVDEAVVFYQTSASLGKIKMAVLQVTDEKWNVLTEIDGEGEDIYRLDFCDINNDGKNEILTSWNTISNSTNHTFNIYHLSKDKNEIKKIIDEDKTINNYLTIDFDNDDKLELILFQITSGNYSASKAELYRIDNNKYRLLGETKLDSRVSSYVNINTEVVDGEIRIYADALNSNGESMLTEIIYWSDTYDTIVSPFYSYSTGITSGTRRDCLVKSVDINDDKLIEIPTDSNIKSRQKELKFLDWKAYKNTILLHRNYTIFVKEDNYNLIIPDEYISKINAKYNNSTKELSIIEADTKSSVLTIKPILKVVYDNEPIEGYEIILEESGYYYLAKLENNKNIKFTKDDLKKYIKTN